MRVLCALAVISFFLSPFPMHAQSSSENKFNLFDDGKKIGTATFTQSQTSVTCDYSYTVNDIVISLKRKADFTPAWEPASETDSGKAGKQDIAYTITPAADKTRLNFDVNAAGQSYHFDFALQPRTVALANFDPSGIQVLLNLMRADPHPDGQFFAFAPMGRGAMVAATLAAMPDVKAADGSAIQMRRLTLAGVEMDIYSQPDGTLLAAEIPAQSVAYEREGFVLPKTAAAKSTATAAESTPAPALPAGAVERDITFPTDGLTAPGTLTLPAGASAQARVPIAVLIGGSGVQDRDETVGANKVLQQLAWALAAKGIATLRYDRRAKFALDSFNAHPDLDHEVVIDAANALKFASTVPEADAHQIFLIGHSLGAQLAPYICARRNAEQPGAVRGEVLLAGLALPIDATILRQISEMGKAQGATDETLAPILADWKETFAQARDAKVPDSQPIGVGTKLPAAYWRDWLRRDAAAEMRAHPLPTLVLRGGDDANVTHEDFTLLSNAAKPAPCAEAREFPGLNHLFMPQKDEMAAGVFSPEAVDVMAKWMKGCAASR